MASSQHVSPISATTALLYASHHALLVSTSVLTLLAAPTALWGTTALEGLALNLCPATKACMLTGAACVHARWVDNTLSVVCSCCNCVLVLLHCSKSAAVYCGSASRYAVGQLQGG